MYKVFSNKTSIFFSDEIPDQNLLSHPYKIIPESEIESGIDMIKLTASTQARSIVFLSPDPEKLKRKLLAEYYPVTAAGGIVTNQKGELLIIFRQGLWDLPKGKVDEQETIRETAIREVLEETGINGCITSDVPVITNHIYTEGGRRIIKETHWYTMAAITKAEPVPQIGEQITIARWGTPKEVKEKIIAETYPLIKGIIEDWYLNTKKNDAV